MKIIVYKNKQDDSILKFETFDKYMEYGHTIEEIEERVKAFDSPTVIAYLHDVADQDYDLIKTCAVDSNMLFTDKLLHSCDEEIPNNTYIYTFYKHKGHDMPSANIMKVFREGVRLPEIHNQEGNLPIAWVRASELCNMLGFSRRNVEKLTNTAKALAWSWYKD